jgi:toxin ParE1/3/4
LDKIAKKYHWLTEYSEAGVLRKELSPKLYSFPVDRYMLYYRKNIKTLELVRVLHGSRDVNLVF